MPLKRTWLKKEHTKDKPERDLFKKVKEEVTMMRKQGEPPEKDPHSFSRYICDLCNIPFPLPELRQCVLCGRWGCKTCWNEEFYTCKSCAGIIKMHTLTSKE